MLQKAGAFRRHHSWVSLTQRLSDSFAALLLLPVLCTIREIPFGPAYQIAAVFGASLTWIAMGAMDVYRAWRGASLWQEMRTILWGWLLVMAGFLFLSWFIKYTEQYSRLVLGTWFLITPLILIAMHMLTRAFLRYMRRHGRNYRSAVIVGAGALGRDLAERIMDADWMGVRIRGFFDDAESKQNSLPIAHFPILGKTSEVSSYVSQHHIDMVYLALPMRSERRMREIFDKLQDSTASVFLVPDLFVFELMGAREQEVAGLPVFALCESPMTGPFGLFKRMEDVVLATLILLIIWPLMLLIGVVIKLTSPGPVLFKQRRYGLNGQPIKVYKFRTMNVCEDGNTIQQAKQGDARVTRFGTFLRRTSLDELPQFFNVLQGKMSIVGPRPHAVAHNEQYRKLIRGYMWRHKVKPGITGLAQVNGWRGETDTLEKMQKRVECDLEYIRRWSVWLDLKLILLTVLKGFIGKNAY